MKATILATLALLLLGAPLAAAEEVTRETYKAEVEPICKVNSEANQKILSGVRKEVKQGKLKLAAKKFAKAAAALQRTYNELSAVPQPAADTARLGKWLGYVKEETELLRNIAKALKAGSKAKAERYVVRLTHNAQLANAEVLSFSFHYCRFEPNKYA